MISLMRRLCLIVIAAVLAAAPQAASADGFGRGAEVARSPTTGAVRFVAPSAPRATTGSREAAGRSFLREHDAAFGLDGDSTLVAAGRHELPGDLAVMRYRQRLSGVPVMGGEFSVRFDGDAIVSAGGEAEPADAVDPDPAVAAAAAGRLAVARVAVAEGVPAARLRAGTPALRIFDARLVGGPGPAGPVLAWAVEVHGAGGAIGRLEVLDAADGSELASMGLVQEALERSVCDAANAHRSAPDCTSPVLREGDPAYTGPVPDVADAYEFAGQTYAFYKALGRDSLDGRGLPLKATVRFCTSDLADRCPYNNAYWSQETGQMAYGAGYAGADDVVAHELTHGLTQYTSNLFYWAQSGAINESLSDVFGELVDQANHQPGEPEDQWLIGEQLPAEAIPRGAIRSMRNPPAFGQPDSMTDAACKAADASGCFVENPDADYDGVHTNSGVGNKAAYLIASDIGNAATARLYYAVATGYLTSASDYQDLATALVAACEDLVGAGVNGFAAPTCDHVRDGVSATAMSTPRADVVDAPSCTTAGQAPAYAFFDDVEDAPSTRWSTATTLGTTLWTYDDAYATSGTTAFWGRDALVTRSDSSIATIKAIDVPAGAPYLRFRHAYDFDTSGTAFRDGGVVQIRAAGDTAWSDLPVAYPGSIDPTRGNPLQGRAFVGHSHGFVTTVVSLADYAGKSVRVRFRIGTDAADGDGVEDDGWSIDDVGVFTCGPDDTPPDTTITSGPDEGATINTATPALTAASTETGSSFRCTVDGRPVMPCASRTTLGPLPDGEHVIAIAAVDPAGNADPQPATRRFTIGVLTGGVLGVHADAVSEGSSVNVITVERTGATGGAATVRLETTAAGSAQPGVDFVPVDRIVSFDPGEDTVSVPITVIDDTVVEPTESIAVTLSGPDNASIGGSPTRFLPLDDNDATPAPAVPGDDTSGGNGSTGGPGGGPPSGPTPATPAPRVRAVRVGRRSITVTVTVPGAGSLAVKGRAGAVALRAGAVRTTAARRVGVRVALPKALRARLRRRAVTAALRVTFTPKGGGAARTVVKKVKLPRRR